MKQHFPSENVAFIVAGSELPLAGTGAMWG